MGEKVAWQLPEPPQTTVAQLPEPPLPNHRHALSSAKGGKQGNDRAFLFLDLLENFPGIFSHSIVSSHGAAWPWHMLLLQKLYVEL